MSIASSLRSAEFKAQFTRSRRGNIWRTWQDRCLTVFRRDDEYYSWCIASSSDDEPEFSPKKFVTQKEALDDLAQRIELEWDED
ncbi:MAG: hypothetical protein KDA93_24695 [Planctomycetaceae bacterium]|nr:hypothetical protein [Planctomycetaceae bacterium]